jgi:DNA-binding transcriptional MocR family regulator
MAALLTGPMLAKLLPQWRSAGTGAAYSRLADAVSAVVLDGRVPAGARMPAERDLALHLEVSRSTVTSAYDLLRERGFLLSRVGAGSWTALPSEHVRTSSWTPAAHRADSTAVDLAVASMPARVEEVMAAVDEARALLPAHLHGHGYDTVGLRPLREVLASRYAARGVPTDPDQVVVTTGAQAGINLVVRALLGPRDTVVVESPTYPAVLDVLRAAGASVHGVGVTRDGWDVEMLVGAILQGLPRLAYLIPDFHNPTGAVLPDEARETLVRAARRARCLLLADETMSDLALEPTAFRPLASYDVDDVVLSVGSTSKTFWGGLRVGWLRVPQRLLPRLLEVRASIDIGPPVLEQLVATALLRDSDRTLGPAVHALREQRDALCVALAEELPAWRFAVPRGGLSVWAELDAPISTALVRAAGDRGPRFGLDGAHERFLRLPYALPSPVLRQAVTTLASARAGLGDTVGVRARRDVVA